MEVILLTTPRNISLLQFSKGFLLRNLKADRYVCIGPKEIKENVMELGFDYLDEDTLYPTLSLMRVKKILMNRIGKSDRGGVVLTAVFKNGVLS